MRSERNEVGKAAISLCEEQHLREWATLRAELWPDGDAGEHEQFATAVLAEPQRLVAFIARDDRKTLGFAEASRRTDYVNGCSTSPVAFLEGLYIREPARRRGTARGLVAAVETWARQHGCSELASDAPLENDVSHRAHRGMGFAETERVVYFLKQIGDVVAQ